MEGDTASAAQPHSRSEGPSAMGQSEEGQAVPELAVPLSKWRIILHVLFTYGFIVGVVLALFFLVGDTGMWVGFGFLALTLPYVLWGATLLYERRPVVVVNERTGISVRHSALWGEKFVPLGPGFSVPWDGIERCEVSQVRLPFRIPTGVSRLKVYLRDVETFVRTQGFVCGRLRFLSKMVLFGTPVVLSDLLLRVRAEAIEEFVRAVQGRQNGPRQARCKVAWRL